MAQPPLFDAKPQLAQSTPWQPLGQFPTPIHRWQGLLGDDVDLWIKRDDQSGEVYGGNKVRKLEFLVPDALARGDKRLLTIGRFGSHHVLATAHYGSQAGLAVDAILLPQPVTDSVRESLTAYTATGANLLPRKSYPKTLPELFWRATRNGTYFIPGGGSSLLGNLGYVSAIYELKRQMAQGECPQFDYIYAPVGSLGTVVGLWLGKRLAGMAGIIKGTEVAKRPFGTSESMLHRLARATNRKFKLGADLSDPQRDLHVDTSFFGDGYGTPNAAAQEAIEMAAKTDVAVELTYSARNLAALIHDARSGLLSGKRVLFIQTYHARSLDAFLANAKGPEALPPVLRGLFP